VTIAATALPALVARGVEVSGGGRRLLSVPDLTLRPGELTGLIGPSGAGKSTLIKVLLGLRGGTGKVTLGGRPLEGAIGWVPQDDALFGTLTVRRWLDHAARLRLPELGDRERAARIVAVASSVELHDRLDVRIRRLSGGQRKRVSVATELLTEPPILVADEPTSGLDPGMEARTMQLFADLAHQGRIVLVATHAMASLHRCDTLLVLVAGRIAFRGPPSAAPAAFGVTTHAAIFDALGKR
jgi:ABC-type multidrug transport system ATPase subunit